MPVFTHHILHNGKVIERATRFQVALRRARDLTDPSRTSDTARFHGGGTALEIRDLRTGASLAVSKDATWVVPAGIRELWDGRCHHPTRQGRCSRETPWPTLYCKRHPAEKENLSNG